MNDVHELTAALARGRGVDGPALAAGRLAAATALRTHAPFPPETVEALALAMSDGAFVAEDRALTNLYSDAEEGLERRYVADAATDALAAHGADALLPVCRVASKVGAIAIDRFADGVGAPAMAALDPATLGAAAELLAAAFPSAVHAPVALAGLRWLLASRGEVSRGEEAFLEHPSPIERTHAAERLAAERSTPALATLLRFASRENDARPACAAVRAASTLMHEGTILDTADVAAFVHVLDTSTAAGSWLAACEALGRAGASARGAARALARHAARAGPGMHDRDIVDVGFAAARALAKIGPLPPEAIAILDAALANDDGTVPYRVKIARGG